MSNTILFIPRSTYPDFSQNKEDEEGKYNPFEFTELRLYCKRLIFTGFVIFFLILCIHFWQQFLCIGFTYFIILSPSEKCINKCCSILMKEGELSFENRSRLLIYSLFDIIFSYLCFKILFNNLTQKTLPDAIVASVLISLFTFVLFGAMKNIAIGLRILRICDIENGALTLLTMMSIMIRYIFVSPIWLCFLNDVPLNQIPNDFSILSIIYLLAKIGGLWVLCVDYHFACQQFFSSALVRAPENLKCQNCHEETAVFFTQCGHVFCRDCIERARKVEAACPVCKTHIPRKWTMPFKYGTILGIVMFCTL